MKQIAVLITCHNRKAKTLRCLESLHLQNGLDSRYAINVFLVDDASTDGTGDLVNQKFPNVKVVQGDGNLYWNRGMHLAWEKASLTERYDYYLWLNDDIILFTDALNELLDCKEYNIGPTIICGSTCSEIGNSYTYGLSTVGGKRIIPNNNYTCGTLMNGNCVLVSHEIFELIGNLDPIYPHAIGDYDYGLRLIKQGGKLITTTKFIAYCEKNHRLPNWCYAETPLFKRIQSLYSPLGNCHPKYYFVYEFRHYGLATALKHFLSIHLRLLMPSLWR